VRPIDNLRSTEIKSSITHNGSVWCIIPLKKGDSLLVGVIYRSPNADTAQNDYLNAMMKEMVEKRNSHLMIMGDFNYPDINWDTQTSDHPSDHPSQGFLSCYRNCFLYQNVTRPTHYRAQQQANILDLMFTNESGMIND